MTNKFITILLILVAQHIHPSITTDTLIKCDTTFACIGSLSRQDAIVSFNTTNNTVSINPIVFIFKQSAKILYQISLPSETITCSPEHLFYDPILKLWVPANRITCESKFLDSNGQFIVCLNIERIELDQAIAVYDITLNAPHTFFISKAEILTHNFIPIIMGLSWTIGEGIAFAGAGIGFGTLGLGFWHTFGKHKKITFAQIEQECLSSSACGSPEDPDEKKKHPHGRYEDAPYHHANSKGRKNQSPKNGQAALDNSIQIESASSRRIAVNEGEFVVLNETSNGVFHGHVRTWSELEEPMCAILRKNQLVNKKGKIISCK